MQKIQHVDQVLITLPTCVTLGVKLTKQVPGCIIWAVRTYIA